MAEGTTPPKKQAAKKPAAKKPATAKKPAAAKPVAQKAAPLKNAATRAAPAPKKAPTTKKSSPFKAKANEAKATVKKEAKALREQASEKAHELAAQGKERASGALDNVAKMIGDAATTVDDRVGTQYGDYTRKAADAVAGFASTLKGKDVDELVKDAGDFVRKSPAVAIGAAAAIGFVLARLIKAGSNDDKA